MKARIAILPGDGAGQEVLAEAVKILRAVGDRFGHEFVFEEALIGGAAIDAVGHPLPSESLDACRQADAVLLGAVGGPKWADPAALVRPEQGLLSLRKELGLFANLRPVRVLSPLADASPLKRDLLSGVDLMIVRELTGGIYFGDRQEATDAQPNAYDTMSYAPEEVRRIAHVAFRIAKGRRGSVVSVDKANVLASSRLWRRIVTEVASEYPGVSIESMLVDAAAMHLLRQPRHFDVLLTANMFGDILADEASMLSGSMGMLPSASLGDGTFGLFEPIHGSAPDIAGQGIVNPLAMILSGAMLLRVSLGMRAEAACVEAAVERVLQDGYRTADIARPGEVSVGTAAMGDEVAERLSVNLLEA
ncbi:MAG: 3-isopropylmalate dehydrogenase [Candidatus Bipolaricaulia bacterium]